MCLQDFGKTRSLISLFRSFAEEVGFKKTQSNKRNPLIIQITDIMEIRNFTLFELRNEEIDAESSLPLWNDSMLYFPL